MSRRRKNKAIQVTRQIEKRLLQEGFIVHRYDSYGSNSCYLKVDFGLCNSIRISDHPGKPTLKFRFNVMLTGKSSFTKLDGSMTRYYYSPDDIEELVAMIKVFKIRKTKELGGELQYNKSLNWATPSKTEGFWLKGRRCYL